MKRRIVLILSVLVLVAVLLPVGSFAAENDKGLENAIKSAKAIFSIPDDYKFDYNVYTENGKNIWYLSWQSKDNTGANINVRVNDAGSIIGFDSWKSTDYVQTKKFPKVTKQEARKIADAFLAKVNPAIASKIAYQDNNQTTISDYAYYFNYYRVENGIPYYSNNVYVNVNKNTGEVNSYNLNWTDGLAFPSVQEAISLDKAQEAYADKIGLRLIYKYSYEEEKVKLYAVYTTAADANSYAINAITGEKVKVGGYYGPYYGDMGAANMKMAESAQVRGQNLTPEEIKAIEEVSKLMTQDQAEKIARDCKYLELTSDFKLQGANLSRNWPLRDEFNWYLNFTREPSSKETEYKYVSATIDAKTGEIKGFYVSSPYTPNATGKYDRDASKAAVEAFLKEFKPDLFSLVEYDDSNYDYPIYSASIKPTNYSFRYIRKVNGAYFPDNYINIDYDAVNGKVMNFNMNWFDMEFPAISNALPKETILQNLYKSVGLELQYMAKYEQPENIKLSPDNNVYKPELIPVYSLKPGKPCFFDVNTGIMLDYDGKPYKEIKTVEYTDIKGHYAENQIVTLAENGIALDGTEFKPDQAITQKDYLTLVSKVMVNYYWQPLTINSTKTEIDNFYSYLIREGVLKQEEKNPDAAVTREDAVKFFINALKYTEVADLKDIFVIDFKDKSKINPDLVGYVAIAKGLKIVSGNGVDFNPKARLTRAEAAVMVYNYLQR